MLGYDNFFKSEKTQKHSIDGAGKGDFLRKYTYKTNIRTCAPNLQSVLPVHLNFDQRCVNFEIPPWRIKIVIACLRTILRDKFQTVGNNLLRYSSPTLKPTSLP